MSRLVFLTVARDDLVAISNYIADASGSRSVARALVDRLRAHCRKLATLPGTLGRARPDLHPDLRSIADGAYVILFRYAGDRLEIIRIIEGHRDLQQQFPDVP